MAVGNGSLAAGGGDDRDVGGLGQFDQDSFCVGAGHAAAGEDEGQAGLGDYAGGVAELFRAGDYS